MRQIKRIPSDKAYDFGLGITDQFGLRKKAGDFITEEEVKKYEVGEQFLESVGTEKEDWSDELPENADRIHFIIGAQISGGDIPEKQRMIDQFEGEFKDYIREKGTVILRVTDVQVVRKKKKKSNRSQS